LSGTRAVNEPTVRLPDAAAKPTGLLMVKMDRRIVQQVLVKPRYSESIADRSKTPSLRPSKSMSTSTNTVP
jgi:hypothetical protein